MGGSSSDWMGRGAAMRFDPDYRKYFVDERNSGNNYPLGWYDWRTGVGPPPVQPPVTPPGTTPGTTPGTPPISDQLAGLMQQAADPWGTYGQLGVNEPYLSNINNRFGWSSEGLAYPTQLQATPTWYNPRTVYPDVVQPPLTVQKK
jgi:hypothetical protein